MLRPTIERSTNNLGALRVFFAVLVILTHSVGLAYGDASRDFLIRIFGTLSFGQLAVDGFFLISGYLVTKSFQASHSAREYIVKRVLRIYPGYVVGYLLCILILAPFVGGQAPSLGDAAYVLKSIIFLHPPYSAGVFAGTPWPLLNGSMWTIEYEFRCYLLVLVAGSTGLLSKRSFLFLLTVGALALNAIQLHFPGWSNYHYHFGAIDTNVRFIGIFACGALFYLYRDRILYDCRLAALAACGLVILMFSSHAAEAAVAILGGYILFWFALNVRSPILATIGQRVDISYGVYLYGWPVQKTLLWLHPGVSALPLFAETTVIASILALGSWHLVEKPFLNLKRTLIPLLSRHPLSRSATELERHALPQKWPLVNQGKEAASAVAGESTNSD